jgi:hypothetical protein
VGAKAGIARVAWMLCVAALPVSAGEFEFQSSGGTYFQYYLNQDNRYSEMPPGYRFAFSIDNLVYRAGNGHVYLNAADATVISRQDTALIKLDQIRYRVDPGYRWTEWQYEASAGISHECIHRIDRERAGGSIFWNSVQASFGTKGAYDHNLVGRVVERDFSLRNSLDYRLTTDAYLHGNEAWFIAQNHDYRAHAAGLLRYNWALREQSAFYADLRQDLWLRLGGGLQYRGTAQFNWILLSRKSIGVLFVEHTFLDQNRFENEDGLWSLGVRILY